MWIWLVRNYTKKTRVVYFNHPCSCFMDIIDIHLCPPWNDQVLNTKRKVCSPCTRHSKNWRQYLAHEQQKITLNSFHSPWNVFKLKSFWQVWSGLLIPQRAIFTLSRPNPTLLDKIIKSWLNCNFWRQYQIKYDRQCAAGLPKYSPNLCLLHNVTI